MLSGNMVAKPSIPSGVQIRLLVQKAEEINGVLIEEDFLVAPQENLLMIRVYV